MKEAREESWFCTHQLIQQVVLADADGLGLRFVEQVLLALSKKALVLVVVLVLP